MVTKKFLKISIYNLTILKPKIIIWVKFGSYESK